MKARLGALVGLATVVLVTGHGFALTPADLPGAYSNIFVDDDGALSIRDRDGNRFHLRSEVPRYSLRMLRGSPTGTDKGIDFRDPRYGITIEHGRLYYGFIKPGDGSYNLPVFFKGASKISGGKATINIAEELTGKYDMVG